MNTPTLRMYEFKSSAEYKTELTLTLSISSTAIESIEVIRLIIDAMSTFTLQIDEVEKV